jgi:hypothetical protein
MSQDQTLSSRNHHVVDNVPPVNIIQGSCPRTRVKAFPQETSCSFFVVCCYAITLTNYYHHQSASSTLTSLISLKHVTARQSESFALYGNPPSRCQLLQMSLFSSRHTGTKPLDRPREKIMRVAR